MAQMDAIDGVPWYRSLNREQWRVLIASNLGWLFDGFEIYALFLTVGFAVKQLLDVARLRPFRNMPAIFSPSLCSAGPQVV
jgi:hypothetical protein